jgi:hypothetical protein
MRSGVVAVVLLGLVSPAFAEDPPIPLEKWGFDYATKTWGMKVSSVSYVPDGTRDDTFLIELTKDLTPEELKAAREAFPLRSSGLQPKGLAFYFFDAKNVVIAKTSNFTVASEITGVKGDAFRLKIQGGFGIDDKDVAKVELRVVR